MKNYPALDLLDLRDGDADRALADLDDFGPVAIEERPPGLRAFFTSPGDRDAAAGALRSRYRVDSLDVPDEDWARRSQQNLAPVTVGRLTIVPPWHAHSAPESLQIVINPSMGFGTGHHATTRLCLSGLQDLQVTGRSVLDIGTGSGVLAIAARLLGAAPVCGLDYDGDAIASAVENRALNPGAADVDLQVQDFTDSATDPPADIRRAADVVLANLTGALLIRSAAALTARVRPEGCLLVSGILSDERASVVSAFAPWPVEWSASEDGWAAVRFRRPRSV